MSAIATSDGAVWRLPKNDVWNVPDFPIAEVRFEIETKGPFGEISKVRGLAVSCDFVGQFPTRVENCRVYGIRALLNAHPSGYQMEGKVSLKGKKYRAFTSSVLFEREDGSLCSVAVLHVCLPHSGEEDQ
jgi:hypothetical protein